MSNIIWTFAVQMEVRWRQPTRFVLVGASAFRRTLKDLLPPQDLRNCYFISDYKVNYTASKMRIVNITLRLYCSSIQ